MSSFGNLRDDSERLNNHTSEVVGELALLTKKWNKQGIDARAIYAGFACFHSFYYRKGFERLGASYMSALDGQADKLATEMLAREKGV